MNDNKSKNRMDWDGLRLFSIVARTGSLAAAAEQTGISAPTLGRQMTALEDALGRKLFVRHQRGYQLAEDGRALLERVQNMDEVADDIGNWSSGAYLLPYVSISAGTWTSRFLARNLAALWTPDDPFRICFSSGEARISLEHREADIGVRNVRPQSGNIASRKGVKVAFATYCRRGFEPSAHDNWVSLSRDVVNTPSSHWVHAQPELWISTWVSTPQMLYEVICGGGGQGVLPCFIGDANPDLKRCGDRIDELEHMTWIVAHDDERRKSEKRMVIDRLSGLINKNAKLFAGELD